MSERIDSNTIFEVKGGKRVTNSLINAKGIAIVVDYIPYFKNMPHYTSF